MIDTPQQVGTPLREIYDPRCQPGWVKGHAQGVNRRGKQLRGDIFQQHGGTPVACDDLPVAVNDKGRIGTVAAKQPVNSLPDVSHV